MGTSLDALNAPSSLTQRRQAASNLPAFELPTLQFAPLSTQKFPPLSGINTSHGGAGPVSVGQLLTPPSNSASESANSSGMPTGTTPNSSAVPVLPYTPTFFNTGTTPNGYHTGYTPQPWQNGNHSFPPRSMFSPLPGPPMRPGTNSPTAGEASALPPPPYDLHNVPPYGAPLSLSSPNNAPTSANSHHIMSSLHNSARPPSQPSPITPNDGKPAMFGSMTSAPQHHQSAYAYSSHTPVSQASNGHSLSASRVSPTLHQGGLPPHSQAPFMRPPPPSYSLPAMPGPIMSNIHSPGSQMAMVGNMQAGMLPMAFNSGYAANPQGMYGPPRTNSSQQAPVHDRPFKCDQCPQSFNRNHDLKRHKRIHLAVKPFPCNYCDKSFSRKDALKRHILVKGCGTGSSTEGVSKEDAPKSESGSDGVNESPAAATAA
ncbi:hypothetical protein LTR10_023086 [Elasticomyces elasticus]|uniref:C2H2-type domain-containing protein n=1 Tax=Exophiala sideris TaxID=1016849 RepID=A0ABR0JL79_9EURO|nr:hypothetical protein LTR10_023086 [Elasticomyces elasticus]KAK5036361.1 hypothetical protein LTS07_002088 [Exophiala sideris]KAK5041807.1 hypothetical protein LTR13_002474 [Exophiala sideris]KAK5066745.1 hypothetical protein LTR69_002092 [Exophiala sideris]KAK5184803.1 hypothetical protein LTR44_002649 [Eurotiomycetes sp. CCFEE 6388]